MKKVRAVFAVLTVVTLFGVVALFCGAGGGGGSEKWEYKVVGDSEMFGKYEAKANELGKGGWELISPSRILVGGGTEGYVFKRRLP